jgi:hypothetical protein
MRKIIENKRNNKRVKRIISHHLMWVRDGEERSDA